MKKFSIYFSVLVGLSILLYSCNKDDHDDNTATITIAEPIADAMYNNGDTVFIRATITAEEAMHGWDVYLRNKATQAEIFTADAHDHAATYNIDTFWVNSVTVQTEMELEVLATIDHDGNTQNKVVDLMCHP